MGARDGTPKAHALQGVHEMSPVQLNLSVNTDALRRPLPSVAPFRGRRLRSRYTSVWRRMISLHGLWPYRAPRLLRGVCPVDSAHAVSLAGAEKSRRSKCWVVVPCRRRAPRRLASVAQSLLPGRTFGSVRVARLPLPRHTLLARYTGSRQYRPALLAAQASV
jgi:hypothetical protein